MLVSPSKKEENSKDTSVKLAPFTKEEHLKIRNALKVIGQVSVYNDVTKALFIINDIYNLKVEGCNEKIESIDVLKKKAALLQQKLVAFGNNPLTSFDEIIDFNNHVKKVANELSVINFIKDVDSLLTEIDKRNLSLKKFEANRMPSENEKKLSHYFYENKYKAYHDYKFYMELYYWEGLRVLAPSFWNMDEYKPILTEIFSTDVENFSAEIAYKKLGKLIQEPKAISTINASNHATKETLTTPTLETAKPSVTVQPKENKNDDSDETGFTSLESKEFVSLLTDFDAHIKGLEEKAKTQDKYNIVSKTSRELHTHLTGLKFSYFHKKQTEESYFAFRKDALAAINKAKPILNKYPDLRQIIENIILAIVGIGVIYGAACLINKKVTGNFLFFGNTTLRKAENIETFVNKLST